ncbi:hypothetical protein KR51_00006470, partial [Rubidibacter lacunae KORDI 51-2]
MSKPSLFLDVAAQTVSVVGDDSPTVSVIWDRAIQKAATDNSTTGPTIASRAYGVLHTAIYEAWSQYDPQAIGTLIDDNLQVPISEVTDENKIEAMTYAAFRVANFLFPDQAAAFDAALTDIEAEFGISIDPTNTSTDASTPAGIGNSAAEAIIAFRSNDGSNQANGFADTTGFVPTNIGPTDLEDTGLVINDIEKWTPEFNASLGATQGSLTPQWGLVTPFALEIGDATRPPAPEPFLLPGVEADFDFTNGTVDLEPNDRFLNFVPVTRDLIGTVINPGFITQAEDVVDASANLTDEQKLIAEFWEDGGGTSFPPGTWMTFGQYASAEADNTLDDDAVFFLALGNAVQDAGIATWEAKYFPDYNYTRPIRAIRELGRLGLIGEENPDTGLFEVDATVRFQGTQTIPAIDFETYQEPDGDPSPPFPEYTSGHSAFSRAGAEVIKAFTGSDEFNQGVTFPVGSARFESGLTPQAETTLFWETYTEAANEAGLSRIFGGIHFDEGDINGRELGRVSGLAAVDQALFFANGGKRDVIYGTSRDDFAVEVGGNLTR